MLVQLIDPRGMPANIGQNPFTMRIVTPRKRTAFRSKAIAAIVCCAPSLPMVAQFVQIPDPLMREWLNGNIPGVVDALGNMDTTYAEIDGFVSAALFAGFPTGPSDLTGIQYLHGLTDLQITSSDPSVVIPAFPTGLEQLTLELYGAGAIPDLPPSLQSFSASGYIGASLPSFPASIRWLSLADAAGLAVLPALPAEMETLIIDRLPALTELPELPDGLRTMWLHELSGLGGLPALPPALEVLTIWDVPVTEVPALPEGLIEITIEGIPQLAQLPVWSPLLTDISLRYLPSIVEVMDPQPGLQSFELSNMPLVNTVPALPGTLTSLTLDSVPMLAAYPPLPAALTALTLRHLPFDFVPALPQGLSVLVVGDLPGLELIPQLPSGLSQLALGNLEDLAALPLLPGSLAFLHLVDLPALQALPGLPPSLYGLYLIDCDGIPCLPSLPGTLFDLTVHSTMIDCLPGPLSDWVIPDLSFDPANICAEPCFANIPQLGGRVFHDMNANGAWDNGEAPLPGAVVTMAPGTLSVSTDLDGRYMMAVPLGSYDLSAVSPVPYAQSTLPSLHSITLVAQADADTSNDFGISFEPGHHDLVAHITATPARPGFPNVLWLSVMNHGTEPTSGEVMLEFDPEQTWSSGSIPPNSLSAQQAMWSLPTLAVGATWSVVVDLSTPVGTALGTPIEHVLSVAADATDEAPGNDQAIWTDVVVGSFDPNDKRVVPELVPLETLGNGDPVLYTIRFQNTGTAAASFVIIEDTLSPLLQWSTIRFEGSSHPCTWEIRSGVLRFTFDPIFLPDSTSDEPGSHGFVRFSMQPLSTLFPGEQVGNMAHIYFDHNPPISTGTTWFSVSVNTGTEDEVRTDLTIHPVPAHASLRVLVPGQEGILTEFEVSDMSGRSVLYLSTAAQPVELPLGALRPGTYVVQARSNTGTWRTRFMKE